MTLNPPSRSPVPTAWALSPGCDRREGRDGASPAHRGRGFNALPAGGTALPVTAVRIRVSRPRGAGAGFGRCLRSAITRPVPHSRVSPPQGEAAGARWCRSVPERPRGELEQPRAIGQRSPGCPEQPPGSREDAPLNPASLSHWNSFFNPFAN